MKTNVIFIALGVLLSALVAGVGAQIISSNNNVQIGGSGAITSLFVPPLTPANGGVGAMTGAPMWARYFGTGVDGAGPASGTMAPGEWQLTSWTCTGAISVSGGGGGLVVRSQGTVALNTGCTIAAASGSASVGDLGGAGGSGGGGAASSVASKQTNGNDPFVFSANAADTRFSFSAAAALSAVAGNDGGAIAAHTTPMVISAGYPYKPQGGSPGTAGGSSGGAGGNGGIPVIIIAPSITIASGVIIDVSGFPGVAPTANSTGAGGGGGGGSIQLYSQTFTDSGGIYRYGGGSGGAITAPSIQATGGGCTAAGGCGTDAAFTITALVGGGLSAANITIANAGTGYQVVPQCKVNAGGSGLVGSPACHFTLTGATIGSVVIDTAGSGGTLTTFTTTFIGGYGANGFYNQQLIQ